MQQQLRFIWPRTELPTHVQTGQRGEEAARRFLSRTGYRILAINARVGAHDEIDIVAYDPADRVMVFVEVKTRARDSADYRPEMNITSTKRSRMARAARLWVAQCGWQGGYRLDAVFVVGESVTRHVKDLQWGTAHHA